MIGVEDHEDVRWMLQTFCDGRGWTTRHEVTAPRKPPPAHATTLFRKGEARVRADMLAQPPQRGWTLIEIKSHLRTPSHVWAGIRQVQDQRLCLRNIGIRVEQMWLVAARIDVARMQFRHINVRVMAIDDVLARYFPPFCEHCAHCQEAAA